MKKTISFILAIIFVAMSFSFCAFAENLKDGLYEVPVMLMHKEDEKESFGAKFISSTALLKKESGKKTVTILLTTSMSGIEFSYYLDGSLSGDTAKATPVSNVTVSGQTYEQGFEVPVEKDGEIGLLFSVPVMPMSPSARLRIDYDNAVSVSNEQETQPSLEETTEKVEETASSVTTTEKITAVEIVSSSSVSQIESTQYQPTTAQAELTTQPTTVQAAATTAATEESTTAASDEEKENSSLPFLLLFVCATAVLVFAATYESKEKKDND